MEFKTDFTLDDYKGLCWFQAKTITIVMSILLSLAFGFTIFAIIGLVAGDRAFPLGIIVALISYPLIFLFQRRSVKKRAKRRYETFGASSELYLVITDEDITQTSKGGDTRLPWEDVYAVRESETSYYVFLTKRKAFYFPKRSFESNEHKKEFLTYIKKYVPEKRIKLMK
ncbi:MAG: YcxB family protein [Ruminococcaceae bacterium]|nr:YcxB family protein [Oscillospiraceae bacterium]